MARQVTVDTVHFIKVLYYTVWYVDGRAYVRTCTQVQVRAVCECGACHASMHGWYRPQSDEEEETETGKTRSLGITIINQHSLTTS